MSSIEQLIHDTTIVTADQAGSILYDAALLVRDSRVAALGPSAELMAKHPERVVQRAVRGMMPRTKLGRAMMRKLKVYAGPEHPHEAQAPKPLPLED